jgi:hypothetical protein
MFTPWNEIRPKKYPSPAIPVVQLWQNPCNQSYPIPLGPTVWNVCPARPVEPGTLRVFNWGGMLALWNAQLIPLGRSLFLSGSPRLPRLVETEAVLRG